MDKQAEIAECAYHIWMIQGCPEGKALEHWLQAEAELAAKTDPPPVLVPVKADPAVGEHNRKGAPKPAPVHHSHHRDAA
jgi:hypothetical protein